MQVVYIIYNNLRNNRYYEQLIKRVQNPRVKLCKDPPRGGICPIC